MKPKQILLHRFIPVIFLAFFLVPFLFTSCTSMGEFFGSLFEPVAENTAEKKEEIFLNPNPLSPEELQVYRDRPMEEKVTNLPKRLRRRMKRNPDMHLRNLVAYLIEDEEDPFIRIKAIHDYICDTIAYDTGSFLSGNISGTNYIDVLYNGKSVCDGYANLFCTMAGLAGYEVIKISGASKGYGFDPVEGEEYDCSHAWNAVLIDDNWYFIDCTWDAGHVKGSEFVKEYETGYLFISPEYMIFTHYPEDLKWQLIPQHIAYEEFLDLHYLRGSFFNYLVPSKADGKRFSVNGELQVTFNSIKTSKFIAFLTVGEKEVKDSYNRVKIEQAGKNTSVHVSFPEPGTYLVRLFASESDSRYDHLGDLIVESTGSSDRTFR